jgi:hypothetical protein
MVNFQGNCCSFIEVLLLMIPIELVYKYGGHEIKLGKDEVLFREGDKPLFYYEIVAGSIKMVNYSQDGQNLSRVYLKITKVSESRRCLLILSIPVLPLLSKTPYC